MPEHPERTHSRAASAASRSETDSPVPSEKSAATQRSERSSTTGPRRSLQSPSVTPRARTTASPRVARTSIPALSPASKRTSASPANSGIPALSRSTAMRNLAGSTTTSAAAKRLGYQPSPGTARAVSNINNGTTQAAKSKGFRLLHDLQARIRATDDRLNTRVSRRNVSTPGSTIGGRRLPASATSANLSSTVAHSRVTQLSKSTTVTTLAGDKGPDGLFSPTNWVLVSDSEDTPVANGHGAPRRSDPASPLDRTTYGQDRKSARSLPQRPGIPSPLAPALSRSVRAPPPQASSQASRFSSSTTSRAALGVSTSRPQSRSHQRTESATMRPPSRTHRRADSSSTRPPSRSHMRTHSRAESRSGSRAGDLSPSFGDSRSGMSPEAMFVGASRPGSRAGSRTVSRASYEDDGELIDEAALERELARRATLNASTLGKSQRLSASATGTYRRVPRRSSLGPAEASLPPSSIPAPKSTTPSRPTSYPVFQNTPPPPVPRIPSMHARARQGDH